MDKAVIKERRATAEENESHGQAPSKEKQDHDDAPKWQLVVAMVAVVRQVTVNMVKMESSSYEMMDEWWWW